MRNSAPIALAGALAAALSLTSCGGDSPSDPSSSLSPSVQPTGHPSTTTSSSSSNETTGSPTSSPRRTQTPMPAAAKQHTAAGAEAFARYYMLSYGEDQTIPTTARMLALSDPNCQGCDALIKPIERLITQGRRTERSTVTVAGAQRMNPPPSAGGHAIELLVQEKEKNHLNTKGQVVASEKSAKFDLRAELGWSSKGWRVNRIGLVE